MKDRNIEISHRHFINVIKRLPEWKEAVEYVDHIFIGIEIECTKKKLEDLLKQKKIWSGE